MQQLLEKAEYRIYNDKRHWCVDEIPILSASFSVPEFTSVQRNRSVRRLNRYYQQYIRSFLTYCGKYLYPQALVDFRHACETGAPIPCAQAIFQFQITYNNHGVLSLYTDCTEWAGTQHALTIRRADTWNLKTGYPLSIYELFPKRSRLRKHFSKAIFNQCLAQQDAGIALYAEDLSHRIRKYFSLRNFYLNETGLSFFFPPYTIASSTEGIPTFLFPYANENGPFSPNTLDFSCNGKKNNV